MPTYMLKIHDMIPVSSIYMGVEPSPGESVPCRLPEENMSRTTIYD